MNRTSPLGIDVGRRQWLGAGTATAIALATPRIVPARCSSGDTEIVRDRFGITLRVGKGQEYPTIASAAAAAHSGDTVEIVPGQYRGDVAVWHQDDLVIRGIGDRPVLLANGHDAEGKAIFVTRGRRVSISNLEFRGARVRDRNGAGIRIERGPIKIAGCHFEDNENGILAGNDPTTEIDILDSSFVDNGAGDGSSHNLYVGTVGRLAVTGCYFARARVGHLLKSRARASAVAYCRLTGEDGTGSYELEFPNGGSVIAIGNLIQQGPRSENSTIVSYGAEGYRWSPSRFVLAFNTIVNARTRGGVFITVKPGAEQADILNNLMVGPGSLAVDVPSTIKGNLNPKPEAFVDAHKLDFRLRIGSPLTGQAGTWGSIDGPRPAREYVHPATSCELMPPSALTPLSPGAFQRLAP